MVDWASGMLGKAGAWLSELKSAHGTPQWLESVKTYAKQIANLVVDAMKSGWRNRNFINTVRYAFGCLFAGPWYEKAYYLLQLIGAIILMIGTAGASIALKIVLAVIQLAILVWDSVILADMLRSKRLQAA